MESHITNGNQNPLTDNPLHLMSLMPTINNRNGFTYVFALMTVIIIGIMLGVIGQAWKNIIKQDREAELLFRGSQIKDAITRWYATPRAGQQATPLLDLKDLLKDPRSLANARYLRRLYTDPITGKDWSVISDPNRGIIGVASTSQEKPLKSSGFSDEFKSFEGKNEYRDWMFLYEKARQPNSAL